MTLHIHIDRTACRGAAECFFRAPKTFELDDEGKASVRDPREDDDETVLSAARSCPNFAISVRLSGRELT